MSLPNYLAKIKSAGVYRYVFDKTDIPESQRDSIRLVVGFSEKGPFNTPVYIDESDDFIRTFGNISRRMERKGIFFHRMALQALKAGPIVCLNLKPFNAGTKTEGDVVKPDAEMSTVYAFNASDVKTETELKWVVYDKSIKDFVICDSRAAAEQILAQIPSVDTVINPETDEETHAIRPTGYTIPTSGNTNAQADNSNASPIGIRAIVSESELEDNIYAENVKLAVVSIIDDRDGNPRIISTTIRKAVIDDTQECGYRLTEITAQDENTFSCNAEIKAKINGFNNVNIDVINLVFDGTDKWYPGAGSFKTASEQLSESSEAFELINGRNSSSNAPYNPWTESTVKFKPTDDSVSTTSYQFSAVQEIKVLAAEAAGGNKYRYLTAGEVSVDLTITGTPVENSENNENETTSTEVNNIGYSEDTITPVWMKKQNMHAVKALAYVASPEGGRAQEGKPGLTAIFNTNRFWKVDAERLHDIKAIPESNTTSEQASNAMFDGKSVNDYIRIVQTGSEDDSCTVFIRPYVPTNYNIKISDWYSAEVSDEMPPYMEPIKDHYLSEFFVEIYVFKGNLTKPDLYAETGTLGSYLNPTGKWQPFCYVDTEGNLKTNPLYVDAYGEPADALDAMSEVTTSNFVNRYAGICFPSFKDANGNFVDIASVFNRDYQEHKMLLAMNENLLDEAYDFDDNENDIYDDENVPMIHEDEAQENVSGYVHALCSAVSSGDHQVAGDITSELLDPNNTPDDQLDDTPNTNYIGFNPVSAECNGLYIKGYKYKSIKRSEKGQALQTKILKVLNYKGIREALTNNIDIDYKYIIDTFQTYPALAMKSQFTSIAKDKFNCLAILNFPPMVEILDKVGWKNYQGGFDMKQILRKGNISLPSEAQGASFAAFYTQLQMTDGSVKFTVPSAALVSNLFISKRALRLPYYIVAGPNYGRINDSAVVGPDYNYARADLDVLEPFGVNAIIHIPRQGIIINGNQTAKQTPVTSLSKVHVRELVTFLQDELEEMLLGYQWELNTATLREMVRAKAEVILGLCQANGGIYDYYVTCDASNNTLEVINNSMLVLDVDIIAAKGTEKIVQTLTLHRIGTSMS